MIENLFIYTQNCEIIVKFIFIYLKNVARRKEKIYIFIFTALRVIVQFHLPFHMIIFYKLFREHELG
jgi:hypothetical protein